MNILSIDLENCFGIGQFNHKLDFSKTNINLIYAPNGTMKTSFAKTMELISKNDNQNSPCDQIYKSKRPKFEILVDQNQITPNSILVINAEDNKYDGSNSISTFLASQELKGRYDKIYRELEQSKSDFINNLRTVSKSTDCESEMIETFSTTENTSPTIYEIINSQVKNLKETFERPQFKYNEIFDKKNLVKKFLDKHKDILKQYVTTFNELLSKSNFFKNSKNNNFGTYQAKEIIKSIEDNSFFDAGHRFVLEDGTEINNSDSLKQIVESEINKILSDGKLRKSFEAVDKAISSNSELRTFKKIIDNNNLLLIQLNDYENFKKDVWIEYLSELKRDAEILNQNYLDKKEEIEKIIKEAKKEIELWNSIIKTFNSRFYVPFKVILTNQEDVILKLQTANLEFEYIEPDEKPIKRSREELLKTLSKGEQRAYFILQFLFEIESRKKINFRVF